MGIDELVITEAITRSYMEELLSSLESDVAIVGGGPSGLTAAYYLAQKGVKTVVFERHLSIGGGMWGGGMTFNKIVVQPEAKKILDMLGVACKEFASGYHIADAVQCACALGYQAVKAGARVFNGIAVEDVVMREERVVGLVLNWTSIEMARLHVDPLAVRARWVVDATGHQAEVARVVEAKVGKLHTPEGKIMGERAMWAEMSEKAVVDNSVEIYPGVYVAGMAAITVFGYPRMGPIFGGMLLSGKKVAEELIRRLGEKGR